MGSDAETLNRELELQNWQDERKEKGKQQKKEREEMLKQDLKKIK